MEGLPCQANSSDKRRLIHPDNGGMQFIKTRGVRSSSRTKKTSAIFFGHRKEMLFTSCWFFVVQEKAPYVADAAVRKSQYEEAMAAYKV